MAFGGHSKLHQKLIAWEQPGTYLETDIVTDDDLLTIAQEVARNF